MYVTVREGAFNNTPYETIELSTWIDNLYAGTVPEEVIEVIKHSRNFFHTRTRKLEPDHPAYASYIANFVSNKTFFLLQLDQCVSRIKLLQQEHPEPYSEMYYTFRIPKASGGTRRIDAPQPYLKETMSFIKDVFEQKLCVQYHDSCYSYAAGRGTKDALMVHQQQHSRWFAKFDMSNFFPSTTKEFLKQQLSQIHPFHFLYDIPEAAEALDLILDLSMLNGGLPQGTPLSPMLTNLMMIPIDHALVRAQAAGRHLTYTRYADDLLFSSTYTFSVTELQGLIQQTLTQNTTPFTINTTKTRYGSSAGSNWNLGLMLNKDNNITVGYKKKQCIRATLNNFLRAFTNGRLWGRIEVQTMLGSLSYLSNIDLEYSKYIVQELETKYRADFKSCVKACLNAVNTPLETV